MRRPLRLALIAAVALAAFLAIICIIAVVAASNDPEEQFWHELSAHHGSFWGGVLVTIHPYLANHPTKNFFGRSPLYWACWEGCTEEAEFLLRHGARIDYADHEGKTCLHAAAHNTFDPKAAARIAGLLLRWGADPLAKDAQGRTPLMVADEVGNREVAALLRKVHP